MNKHKTLEELFKFYEKNLCSEEQVLALLQRFRDPANEGKVKNLLRLYFENSEEAELSADDEFLVQQTLGNISSKIRAEAGAKQAPLVRLSGMRFLRVAAAVIILFLASGYFLLKNRSSSNDGIAREGKNPNLLTDILPGGNKAVLTLGDNSRIILDNAGMGQLADQGNSLVIKSDDGQLKYSSTGKASQVVYNTVSTPRGGQYQVVLSDGSKVWLNAASSLRFPTAFTGEERNVEITGEVYFEVAKNASRPFKVSVNGMQVLVTGTHFNINAYPDETTVRTTLLEGSVAVKKEGSTQLLEPGQQAQVDASGRIVLNKNVDVDEVMAWKNGKFQFGEASDITAIMRQISRWYDVTVEVRATDAEHIGGSISRDVKLSQVLNMLELTGSFAFQVEKQKVIVLSK